MNPILLVGAKGNMGQRYSAVLRHLGVPFIGIDAEVSTKDLPGVAAAHDRVILATPTDTHSALIRACAGRNAILCEKPICKDPRELDRLFTFCECVGASLSMVLQYRHLTPGNPRPGETNSAYNYFKHGSDGLAWDCLQILALSDDEPELAETSPIWTCRINGIPVSIADMDTAYIQEIGTWAENPRAHAAATRKYILRGHERAQRRSEDRSVGP